MELSDKVCLIAGASGAIGTAIAEKFSEAGAHLALTYHSVEPRQLLEKLSQRPRPVVAYPMDVGRWEEVQSLMGKVLKEFGKVDVLVNCVGVLGPVGPTSGAKVEDWVKTIESNLIGCFHLVRAVLPHMLAQRSGKIILLSGGGAAYARPYFTAYSASKAAVVRFAESLAEELKGSGIQVNAIAPGPVKSRMWDQMRAAGASGGPTLIEELRKMDESGGVSPERAAALALFLASVRSDGLTGRLISAVYDPWEQLEPQISKTMSSDAGTLRRVPFE